MDKRYQVFLSSTYADLKEERQKVIQTLMEMDCIPSGMELFPAVDEEQFQFIKRVIDDCDYYIVIIGGRYGTTTPEGISYTEKEYDYALEKEIKVIAFLHENPKDIPAGKTDLDPELRDKLNKFRNKVSEGRLVKFWKAASELPGLVALSLSKTIKTYPAVGWVRANAIANAELLFDYNELQKKYKELEPKSGEIPQEEAVNVPDLASLDETFKLNGGYETGSDYYDWDKELTWLHIFGLISPYLLQNPNDDYIKEQFGKSVFETTGRDGYRPWLNDQKFQTVKVQLMALNLVDIKCLKTVKGGMDLFWSLKTKGKELMMQTRTVKKKDSSV